MIDIDFGINIVEIVTKGLYTNSLDALREYIQNSCDAIDDAVKAGILAQGDGTVTIDIDESARKITIEDNGMGLSTRYFGRTMGSIGNSDKSLKTDRGFRGIGRLGGLAYCDVLIFSSKVAGEKKISTLTFNAKRLRDGFWHERKRSAESALIENMRFDTFDATDDAPEHFFRVEMIDVVKSNKDLLDAAKVREYLSFVAPVTYSPNFYYQELIYKHAAELNFRITEYDIRVNGEQLVKNYKTNVRTKSGEDEIFGVEFRDLYDTDGNLIAWLWFGLSTFKGVLSEAHDSESYKMRGLRLRLGNIQIGDAEVLKNLFSESRGWKYFIGEIHAVDKKLRPNSKRDDFEESEAYNTLKAAMKNSFKELHDIYHDASDIRSAQKAINAPAKAEAEFDKRSTPYQKTHQAEYDAAILMLKKAAAKAEDTIAKKREESEATPDSAQSKVVRRILEKQPTTDTFRGGVFLNLNRRNLNCELIFRRRTGHAKNATFIGRLKPSSSTTRNLRATNCSTRLKRCLPNEPRPVNRTELQEQVHSREFDEAGVVLSLCARRRRAFFQGRPETFRRATAAGKIFRGGLRRLCRAVENSSAA